VTETNRLEQKIRTGVCEIIHDLPDQATIDAKHAAGYDMVRLINGDLAWVHETGMPKMTDADVADMVDDLYDTEWRQKMLQKFFR
jgi:hypothetical protein